MGKIKTLTDKWFELKREVDQLNQQRIDDFFHGERPAKYYIIRWRGTEIEEWDVAGFRVTYIDMPREPALYGNKNVTKKFLKECQDYLDGIKVENNYDILVYIKRCDVSSSIVVGQMEACCSFYRDDLEEKLQENREKYLPRNGFKPCYYCRVQKPEKELISRTITSRRTGLVWNDRINRFEMKAYAVKYREIFCSAECAAKMQMASEG